MVSFCLCASIIANQLALGLPSWAHGLRNKSVPFEWTNPRYAHARSAAHFQRDCACCFVNAWSIKVKTIKIFCKTQKKNKKQFCQICLLQNRQRTEVINWVSAADIIVISARTGSLPYASLSPFLFPHLLHELWLGRTLRLAYQLVESARANALLIVIRLCHINGPPLCAATPTLRPTTTVAAAAAPHSAVVLLLQQHVRGTLQREQTK